MYETLYPLSFRCLLSLCCALLVYMVALYFFKDCRVERHGLLTDEDISGSRCRQEWCYLCGRLWTKGHLDVHCG